MNDIQAALDKLNVWQFTMLASGVLLALGFTGSGFGFELIAGKEDMAIMAGMGFAAASVLLKYIPPPEARDLRQNNRPKIAISAQQMALASSIADWTDFQKIAENVKIPDHKLPHPALKIKVVELRLELATLQGLLMRRIDEGGHHEVKYRYDDETVFQGEDVTERR